ncbi:MAG: hypothetical protein PHN47_08305 [Clostridia bacterium]|nr:hypothetical protein [Clostridia bacterium]
MENNEHICCVNCDKELELLKVNMTYLKSTFPTRILRCPQCGQPYISEELALGKAQEVEESLEQK